MRARKYIGERQKDQTDKSMSRQLVGQISINHPARWDGGGPESTGAIVTLRFLGLFQKRSWENFSTEAGVSFAFDRRVWGGEWLQCGDADGVSGQCKSAFNRTFTVARPPNSEGQNWEIQVRRLTPDNVQWVHNRFFLYSTEEIFADGRRRP